MPGEVPIGNRSVVVRITDHCNNQCKHCCFTCGTKNDQFMSQDVAQAINDYFQDTATTKWWFNMMGGEPTLHPDYEKIMGCFSKRPVRLVTNGWWIRNEAAKKRFIDFLLGTDLKMHVGVSRDKFHIHNTGVDAFAFLQGQGVKDDFGLSTPNPEDEEGSIAMVGRAYWNEIGRWDLNTFGCYCQSSNTRNNSFTVLEDGTATHCPFGLYPIGNVLKTKLEDLDAKKKEMTARWLDSDLSCRRCYEFWEMRARRIAIGRGYDIYTRSPL